MTARKATAPTQIVVELIAPVDDRSFYVRGWLTAPAAPTIQTGTGERFELHDAYRYERDDVGGSGFAAYVRANRPIGDPAELSFDVTGSTAARPRKVVLGAIDARNTILSELGLEPPGEQALLAGHVHPALERLREHEQAGTRIADVRQHGTPPASATVSVVVPLYQRVDLIEAQLPALAGLSGVDLVYVLDSPELADDLHERADRLATAHSIPFRTAVMSRNAGYSAANNAGAELAKGRLLLLLNSDVVPGRQGWLRDLTRFYDATDRIGALGPRLLYPDGRIQHAGMYFAREPSTGFWSNEHYFKGQPGDTPGADATRRVPAVTGATLLIDRRLYDEVGGLDGRYVQGDFEDSHLCLRLAADGLDTWYLGGVSLAHAEGQSYPAALRRLTWRYNAWLHTSLWRAEIEELMNTAVQPA